MIAPTPFLARSAIYHGAIVFAAFFGTLLGGTPFKTKIEFRVTPDGKRWYDLPLKGDIVDYISASPGPGAFAPTSMMRFGSKLLVVGSIYDSGSGSRAGLFVADVSDIQTWNRVATPADGTVGAAVYLQFLRGTSKGGRAILANTAGAVISSADAMAWQAESTLPFPGLTLGIAASTSAVVAYGIKSDGYVTTYAAASPAGGWTQQALPINVAAQTSTIITDNTILLLPAVGAIFTSPGNASGWTQRGLPSGAAGDSLGKAVKADKWIIGGPHWLESADGISGWAISTDAPTFAGVADMIHAAGKTVAIRSDGQCAVRADGGAWQSFADVGLPTGVNTACLALAA